ncbi:hypothetical protein ABZP36_028700 [Zizania latifolia]
MFGGQHKPSTITDSHHLQEKKKRKALAELNTACTVPSFPDKIISFDLLQSCMSCHCRFVVVVVVVIIRVASPLHLLFSFLYHLVASYSSRGPSPASASPTAQLSSAQRRHC